MSASPEPPARDIQSTQTTSCCVVGGGPAGAMLALLLARQGIPVTLLEAHRDFDREFRGDTLHPSVLEILAQLGLAEKLLELPHVKLQHLTFTSPEQSVTLVDLSRLNTSYPYIAVLPQVKFLEFIVAEAERYPHFQRIMGANVQEAVVEGGTVLGARYRGQGGWHEVRAPLTVGADGRFSRTRHWVGCEPIKTSPPMDVLWFRLPKQAGDVEGTGVGGRVKPGRLMAIIDRGDYWQLGYVIFKGSYGELREAGIEALRQSVGELAPEFRDRVHSLQDWSQISLLSVESSRMPRWYCPGLLLIGDAAHVMSPVGGVGINYAIQDAVVAANLLSAPLKSANITERDLAAVQRQREFPTRVIQAFQSLMQERLVKGALNSSRPFKPPFFLKLPLLRDLPAKLIGFGVVRVRVQD